MSGIPLRACVTCHTPSLCPEKMLTCEHSVEVLDRFWEGGRGKGGREGEKREGREREGIKEGEEEH